METENKMFPDCFKRRGSADGGVEQQDVCSIALIQGLARGEAQKGAGLAQCVKGMALLKPGGLKHAVLQGPPEIMRAVTVVVQPF